MKKQVTVVIAAAAFLVVCWAVGQTITGERTSGKENVIEDGDVFTNSIWDIVSFEGNRDTGNNPWGITAGWFEMDSEDHCILLMPDSAVKLNDVNSNMIVSFDCDIHPWVKEKSDGVGLIVWLLDG